MNQLTLDNLEAVALGAAVLGSGGGGNPFEKVPMIIYHLKKYGPVDIVSLDMLTEHDLVVPLTFMGAPLVSLEKISTSRELETLLMTVEKSLGKKATALVTAEIGGANSLTPFLVAGKLGLPVVDADMIGRAFPQLQMSSCYLAGMNPAPAFQSDGLGNTLMFNVSDPNLLEEFARATTVVMGSHSAVAFYILNGPQAAKGLIHGSLSQAYNIGTSLMKEKKIPNGKCLAQGMLVDNDQRVQDGFLIGTATLLTDSGSKIVIHYQNEYLAATNGNTLLACTPDIIVLFDEIGCKPITSESLRYGLQLSLIKVPAPAIWTTQKGLSLVGPQAFGYSFNNIINGALT